jgi:two-component system sensor histidine kinase VanS
MVMVFLPKNYQVELQNQFTTDLYKLTESLEKSGWEDISQDILAFSIRNNAFVRIEDEAGNEMLAVNISNDEKKNNAAKTLSSSGSFTYKGKNYRLLATASLIAVAQSYDILVKLIPFIAGMILMISVIAAYVCSRYFSKPLIDICGVAKRMTRLDMTWKCDESRSDEIGQLAGSLNEMSAQLSGALESLQSANEQLQSDIEKQRRQERQRIDFFTSVSHELKTPITIIKGELEGMIYKVGEYKDRDAYLKHALKTATDMEILVKDILSAARMGGSDFQLLREKVDMTSLVERCCRKVKGIAEDKKIKMLSHLQQNVFYHGDERLLQQAVSNIINNAVIYSPEQAEVEVELSDAMLNVHNTGVHIKDEDLEQLFIPFFRVDKSRNRNTGGSGLGLYIVKTIFDHHRISYKLGNTENGVKFTVGF